MFGSAKTAVMHVYEGGGSPFGRGDDTTMPRRRQGSAVKYRLCEVEIATVPTWPSERLCTGRRRWRRLAIRTVCQFGDGVSWSAKLLLGASWSTAYAVKSLGSGLLSPGNDFERCASEAGRRLHDSFAAKGPSSKFPPRSRHQRRTSPLNINRGCDVVQFHLEPLLPPLTTKISSTWKMTAGSL